MSNSNVGAGILVLGELSHIENKAKRAINEARAERDNAINERNRLSDELNHLVFAAKSQIHGARARIEGHMLAENELISALKESNPIHPLASHEAVSLLVEKNRAKAIYDKDVAKKTYPNGIIPEDSIRILEDGSPGVVGGQPANPDKTPEQLLVYQERADMLAAAGLDGYTILDPGHVTQAIADMQEVVKKTSQRLAEDSDKGFFGRMKKSDKAAVEADLERSERYVVLLSEALPKAEEYVNKHQQLN